MTAPPGHPNAIDLNCDLGESDEPARQAADLALLAVATSVNVACGGHAGSTASMERTVRAALRREVSIGAHPSFADRANFGRIDQALSPDQIERAVGDQVRSLDAVARRVGASLTHVKPHGALYHAAMTRLPVADAVARAIRGIDPSLVLVGLAGAPGLERWRQSGFTVAAEAFADRRYERDGTLRRRDKPDSVVADVESVVSQGVGIVLEHVVRAIDRTAIVIRADTICIHSDTPGAVHLATALRTELERRGVRVQPFRGVGGFDR